MIEMALTYEQAKIAKAIQTAYYRLVKKGKKQAAILGAMSEYMPDFKRLLEADVADEAAERYPGFHEFAKLLEHLATAIASGAIPVPGKQTPPRQNDPMSECRQLAAAMDLRMRQLEAEGVPDSAVLERMTGHILELHKIWTSTTDDELIMLSREYPGFYHYAALMEDAAEAERQKPARSYDGLPEFPDALKEPMSALLGTAARLERDYQAVLDAGGAPVPEEWITPLIQLHTQWKNDFARFKAALQSAGVPQKSRDIILPALEHMGRRIIDLEVRAQGA